MEKDGFNRRHPLRVLLVSPKPPPTSGIGRWTILLLKWLEGQADVSIRCVDTTVNWRAVDDLHIWKRLLGGGLQGIRNAWQCLAQIMVFRPHVMHLCTSAELRGPWDTVMLALATLLRIRSVYHIHMGRMPEVIKNKGWEWWGLRWALRLADRVVVLDVTSEHALQGFLPAGRVVRLPNAICLQAQGAGPSKLGRASMLYLGYIVPTKGLRELMEAWRELRPPGWHLRLAGPGGADYHHELQNIVGPEAGVEFLGDLPHDQAWAQMLAADVFVLPTYTEGFPYVILEAMAAGKAIVSTRVGAIPEMLDMDTEQPCGIVIEPRDVGALVEALRQVMADSDLRHTLGERARRKVERCYTEDVVFRGLLELWHELAVPERQLGWTGRMQLQRPPLNTRSVR